MPNTPAPAVPQAAAVPTPASSPTETNTGLVLSPPGRTEAAPSPADNPSPRVEAPPAAAVAPAEIPSAPARSTIAPPPAAAAAAPAPAMNDEDAIQQLLNEYRSAYEALDIDRVLRVYPALQNPDALRSAFRDAKEVLIGFTRPVIRITSPAAAIVTCKRTQTFVPKIGGGGRAATTNTTFALRKEGTRWVIVNIS
jgi:ketosteroid isomerase-like protein